jgi:hypothetical protein
MKDVTLDWVNELIGIGVFPVHARSLYERTLRRINKVYAMDYFTAGVQWAHAVVDREDNTLYFVDYSEKGDDAAGEEQLMRIAFHEFKHRVGTETGCGLSALPIVDESIVEHAELSASGLQPDPHYSSPHNENAWKYPTSYAPYRDIIHVATREGSPEPISVAQLNDAFYDVSSSKLARRHAIGAIDRNIRAMIPGYADGGLRGLGRDVAKLDRGSQEHDTFLTGLAWHGWLFSGFKPRTPGEHKDGLKAMASAKAIKARLDAAA